MHPSGCWFLVLGLLCARGEAREVSCYAPDGRTVADNITYVPCNKLGIEQDGVESSCCRLDGDAEKRDLCATSGLCLNKGVLFRGYCTDKTWKSSACVSVCTDSSDKFGASNSTVEITPCTDGTYCCGHNNLGCCGTEKAFELPTQASVAVTNTTETSIVTQIVTPSTYKNATIGLSAVLGAGALAAICAIVWLMKQNRYLRNRSNMASYNGHMREAGVYEPREPYLPPLSEHDRSVVASPVNGGIGPGTPRLEGHDIASAASPENSTSYFMYNNKTPTTPGVNETETPQEYSELDGTTAGTGRVQSRIPGFESSMTPPIRMSETGHVAGQEHDGL